MYNHLATWHCVANNECSWTLQTIVAAIKWKQLKQSFKTIHWHLCYQEDLKQHKLHPRNWATGHYLPADAPHNETLLIWATPRVTQRPFRPPRWDSHQLFESHFQLVESFYLDISSSLLFTFQPCLCHANPYVHFLNYTCIILSDLDCSAHPLVFKQLYHCLYNSVWNTLFHPLPDYPWRRLNYNYVRSNTKMQLTAWVWVNPAVTVQEVGERRKHVMTIKQHTKFTVRSWLWM